MFRVHVFIISFVTILHPTVCSRTYDIETEAMKLYGEDLSKVIKRFRRTPEYLKIFRDTLAHLEQHCTDVSLQIVHYYTSRIPQRVTEVLGGNKSTTHASTPAPDPGPESSTHSYYKRFISRRQSPVETIESEKELERKAVKRLDKYRKLNSPLTITERNSFKDLGFQYAGHIVHGIIKNMGADRPEVATGSTMGMVMENQGQHGSNITTPHVEVHEVTTNTTSGASEVNVKGHVSLPSFRAGKKALSTSHEKRDSIIF